MRLIIQRVKKARVKNMVEGRIVGSIGKGLFVLVGMAKEDNTKNAEILAEKLSKLRIMSDDDGKMNLSLGQAKGSLLIVSQFTLYADTSRGNRPSFVKAAEPRVAENIYDFFVKYLKEKGLKVETGSFGKFMQINLVLDGPVTIILEN